MCPRTTLRNSNEQFSDYSRACCDCAAASARAEGRRVNRSLVGYFIIVKTPAFCEIDNEPCSDVAVNPLMPLVHVLRKLATLHSHRTCTSHTASRRIDVLYILITRNNTVR